VGQISILRPNGVTRFYARAAFHKVVFEGYKGHFQETSKAYPSSLRVNFWRSTAILKKLLKVTAVDFENNGFPIAVKSGNCSANILVSVSCA